MTNQKKQKGSFFVIVVLLMVASGLTLVFLVLPAFGERSGVEFSPDDFTMRKFDYCRLPILNWTNRGIDYKALGCATGQTLVTDDWIRVTGRSPKRWHLVSESGFLASSRQPKECEARFLTEYFELTDTEGSNLVLTWTNNNPESAKFLWPKIAELARDRVYLPIPSLLDFALSQPRADKNNEFKDTLEQMVAKSWSDAAFTDQLNEKHTSAVFRFDQAIKAGANSEDIVAAREKSQSLAGNSAKP